MVRPTFFVESDARGSTPALADNWQAAIHSVTPQQAIFSGPFRARRKDTCLTHSTPLGLMIGRNHIANIALLPYLASVHPHALVAPSLTDCHAMRGKDQNASLIDE